MLQTDQMESEVVYSLPTVITSNTREKLIAEQVSIGSIKIKEKQRHESKQIDWELPSEPRFPIQIVYWPTEFAFQIGDFDIIQKLRCKTIVVQSVNYVELAYIIFLIEKDCSRVWNTTMRTIYISCLEILNKSEPFGANFYSYPRTRFLLAPGLGANFYIKATPEDFAPSYSETLTLRLAAAHLRDIAVTYFKIPIVVTFLKYIPINLHGG